MDFPTRIVIEELFAEDLQRDTLVKLKKLEAELDMLALLDGKVAVGQLKMEGLTANLRRMLPDSSFNFDFLIQAFATKESKPNDDQVEKDSTSLKISIDRIDFQNLNLLYEDAVTGTYAQARIGELHLSLDEIDLEKLKFKANELRLANTDGVFEIRKSSVSKPNTGSSLLPDLGLKKLSINTVNFGFHNLPDSSFFDFRLGNVLIEPKEIDLNKQWINLKRIRLHKSNIRIAMHQKPENKAKPIPNVKIQNQWKAALGKVDFMENQFTYAVSNRPKTKAGIDYNHLNVSHIRLQANNLFYSPSLIKGKITEMGLKESCGLVIRQFHTHFQYDSTHAELAQLRLETDKSRISNHIYAAYPSISSLAQHIENLEIRAYLDSTRISLKDVLLFDPDLIKQPIIRQNQNQLIYVNGRVTGLVKDLLAQNLEIRMAQNTRLALSGTLKGLPDSEKTRFNLKLNALTTSRKDLYLLLPKSILPSSVRVPDQFTLSGNAKGMLNDLNTELHLKSSDGLADVKASLSRKSKQPSYSVLIKTDKLHLGRILKQNPLLGRITASFQASGKSYKPEQLQAELSGRIQKIELKEYDYQNITLSTKATKGIYKTKISAADPNLILSLNAEASLKKGESYAQLFLGVKVANLKALKLYDKDLKTSMQLQANVQNFDLENMHGKLTIKNLLVLNEGQKIEMDSLVARTDNEKGNHLLQVKSDVLDLKYNGNIGVEKAVPALQNFLENHLGNERKNVRLQTEEFSCAIEVKHHPLFNEVLVPDLKKFSGLSIDSKFNNKEQTLTLNARSDLVQYGENAVQGFHLKMSADASKIGYETSIENLKNGGISIPKTTLTGLIANRIVGFGLTVSHPDSGYRFKIQGSVNQQKTNETTVQLSGGNITTNNTKWRLEPDNAIRILPGGINIQKFGLEQNGQFIKAQSVNSKPNAPIDIQFHTFEIGTLSKIIEKDTALVRGLIDGEVHVQKLDPFAFTSNLNISNIEFREIPVGNLQINANNLTANRYTAVIALTGDSNDVKLNGYYQTDRVDFDLNINQLRMKSLEAFTSKFMKKSTGYLTGKLGINGKVTEPKIEGTVTFKNAGFNLVPINNQLLLKDESIRLDNQGIHFKNFTILDSDKQPMQVNGSVLSSNLTDMKFDLDISTQNFSVLRTTQKDNPAYFGTMILNSQIKIRGNQNLPVVSAQTKLLDGSTFTFVVLEGDLNTSKGEGVVVFEDSASRLNRLPKDTLKMKTEFKGIDLTANIEVDKNSIFRVVVDPESGDNLEVSGDANLAFGIDPSGKVSLSGVYTLNDGHYQASFQKVLKREFKIKLGSRITWSGDPMDGQIDLTAIYKTQAAATDLLAAELAGVSENERMAYRKLLNYNVNLNIEGPLLKPQLSFNLDMPPADQLAFGGLVYAKVNVLNTDPNELNKQVFSLLVLNKFLPTGASNTGAGNAVSTLARNSVNQMLTDQLNALSGKYIKGAELNFNLQTTEDYSGGAANQNTELQVGLKKELFNSRLSLQVGSSIDLSGNNQNTSGSNGQSLSGDVQVEYKLTQDGRFRMKAFRENQYEGVIDGILYKTGLGISYSRDYNYFRDLWKSPKKEPNAETKK